jgi:predicted  nucleic acid-binding Zn-ribbon protein
MPLFLLKAGPLLKEYWLHILVIVIMLGMLGFIGVLKIDNANQRTEIVKLEAENTTLSKNNELLSRALDVQNTAIGKLSDTANDAKKNFDKLNTTVVTQNAALDAKLNQMLKDKKPVTCQDTIKYLIDAKAQYK